MVIEIICRTGKGKKSKENEINRTCDEVMRIGLRLNSNIIGGDVYCDGTSLILERKT